jgi:hypothetical protein
MRLLLALTLVAAATTASAAEAAPLDRLFSTPHLATLTADRPITYRHVRTHLPDAAGTPLDEVITLERGADGAGVVVTMDAGGTPRPSAFRGMTGNPILMVFLESVVKEVSEATGGSPFYLRNRIKDALRDSLAEETVSAEFAGAPVEAHRIALRPFEGDAHAAELGTFADLELAFVLADAAPGSFLSLLATAGANPGEAPAYSEEIRLDETR